MLRFESLPSTSDLARELADAGKEEGLAVVAREQTAGRGRLGRSWSSPLGEGVYLSLILRPALEPNQATVITLGAAVAVAETLTIDFEADGDIKWPNDVLVGGKKISGILVEAATERDRLSYVILGIGVNVAQREFPAELRETATSLLLETGRLVSTDDFVTRLLDRLESWYRKSIEQPAGVIARWQELSTWATGRAVRVVSAEGEFEGVTRGLTAEGALAVELDDGGVRRVFSGQVTLRQSPQSGRQEGSRQT